MKKLLITISGIFLFGFILNAQDYRSHQITEGETLTDIAKKYNVTPFDLEALNKNILDSLYTGVKLVIPETKYHIAPVISETKTYVNFLMHKVKKRQTLFGIAQQYDVLQEDIKKLNPHLYSKPLQKKERIKIPVYEITTNTETLKNTLKHYTVLAQEGKWRVAYKHGISVKQLEKMNPGMGKELKVNQIINVPNIDEIKEQTVDANFDYYTVANQETFYGLERKMGLTKMDLEALNPILKNTGLKSGMILKVPKNKITQFNQPNKTIKLSNYIKNYSAKKIALLMPYRLDKIKLDSAFINRHIKPYNSFTNKVLDFHSGALIALDSIKELGISTQLDVFDTKLLKDNITSIIENKFDDYDAVIGPLTQDNFDHASFLLERSNTPIISPLFPVKTYRNNVFQSITDHKILIDAITNYVDSMPVKTNKIIISDSNHAFSSAALKTKYPDAREITAIEWKKGKKIDAFFVLPYTISSKIKPGINIVFLETNNTGLVSNILSDLAGRIDKQRGIKIILMTTNKKSAFDKNYTNLASLNFHYPSVNKSLNLQTNKSFIKAYKTKFNTTPNKYVIRGYDLMYDTLLRLAYTNDTLLESSTLTTLQTEYIENKFNYAPHPSGKGFTNLGVYIMKYDKNLNIVEAKQ